MFFDREQVRDKMQAWEGMLMGGSLPAWEDFPALPLYMDQVIYLMNRYLPPLLPGEPEEQAVTPAMINNYVKLKIIPAPVKKRYSRVHLAYLVMVCMLKQTLNTTEIRRLVPPDLAEDTVRSLYAAFTEEAREVRDRFCRTVRDAAQPALTEGKEPVTHLVFQFALTGNLFRALSKQIVSLRGEETPPPEGK